MKSLQVSVIKILSFAIVSFGLLVVGCNRSSELEWNQEEGYRWAEISTDYFGETGFQALHTSHTGISFVNQLSENDVDENRHYLNGSGVAAGDIDGDGLIDLYFAGLNSPNKLYKNMGGMRFEDITEQAGVAHEDMYSTGVVFADVNGDDHLDLLVTAMHGENTLYINDGNGKFQREQNSGLESANGSNTMTLSDLTGNGYPDLYITNYKEKSVKDIYTTAELDWNNILAEPLIDPTADYSLVPPFDQHYQLVRENGVLTGITEIAEEDELYINNGGKFEKVSDTKSVFLDKNGNTLGLQPDWGLTAKFHDMNNDGLQDLYVCNDFHTPDRVWINQGMDSNEPGLVTFQTIGWEAIRSRSYSCMSVDFSDVNRDGSQDIFTTEMLDMKHQQRLRQAPSMDHVDIPAGDIESQPMYNRNSMYIQRNDGTFAETSWLSGLEASGWSWATRFMDIDLDGYEDLIVATGYLYNILDIDAQIAMARNRRNMDEHFMDFVALVEPLKLENKFFKNNGNSESKGEMPTFSDVSTEWGITESDISQGMALADLNNDGDLDIIINRMNSEAVIYENTTNTPRIAVRLKGTAPNTQALGAKIKLNGGPVSQTKEITAGGDYASGSDLMVMFAADIDNSDHKIEITWPDRSVTSLDSVQANRIYTIDQSTVESESPIKRDSLKSIDKPLFEDISGNLNHSHHEDSFDDFRLQPLLPVKLSQQGPGVAWLDLDGSGQDDLLVGSGKGGSMDVFENINNGQQFQQKRTGMLNEIAKGDQTAIIGWHEDNYTRVLVGSANYEQGSASVPSVYDFKIYSDGTVSKDSLEGIFSTTGPLAATDMTGNGYLDLFVGGNFEPGQYPADANSRFFRNINGKFELDEENSQVFARLGLVSGAVFSDFNRDGNQELLVSTEWGTLRMFEFRNGTFQEITNEAGLNQWSGWWKGVSTGDFNNDGLPDIVAANIGKNTPYQIRNKSLLRTYYKDLAGMGAMDIMEAYADENGNYLLWRRLYKYQEKQIMLNRMGSHKEFAGSTLKQILGNRYTETPYKEINTLDHMIFINTGEGFEAQPLPQEAQLSMAFHPAIGDFNNDGNEDLFLSQNLFAVSEGMSRIDNGRGLVMFGDGNGKFTALSGDTSGIKIYGEQRGAALGDLNKDGKIDLAVSQNGAETKLFLNNTANQGYRVKLQGPESNRDGVGSALRLVYENGEKGPLREIQSGNGYWSQNSFTQILGAKEEVDQVEVFWFNGTVQTVDVQTENFDYVISYPNQK